MMLQVKYLDSVKILSVNYEALIESIEKACREIREIHESVRRIFLFGSFSRGNYTPASDVDILIVVSHTNIPFMERRDLFTDYFNDIPFDMNVLVYTENELNNMLKQENLFIKSVLTEAKDMLA